jgi:acyl carrier protein
MAIRLTKTQGGNSMSVEQDVLSLMVQTLSVQPEEIEIDERLCDSLGVDSTEMVELVIVLEKKFGITIEDEQITKFSSPREIIALMTQKTGTV